ncbi:MAG: hypothetical protein M3548_11105 [Actinomycetota bacterium]|nr:hypothetical protein [Actinomycetota bacterium]
MTRGKGPTRLLTVLAVVFSTALALLFVPGTAGAWSIGVNRVQTAVEDGALGTGYGPGWVLMSYKANGPMVGYLFAKDFRFADGSVKPSFDHMDIRDTGDSSAGNPEISRWPWGYAGGSFDGCAYAYGTSKFAIERTGFSSPSCAGGPNVRGSSNGDGSIDTLRWWHSEEVFCTANSTDGLCSPYGVWSANKGGGLKVARSIAACSAYGNIGAAAAYGSGPARPTHLLGTVPANSQVDIRYVTKDRQWVMAKWNGQALTAGIHWAFMPRNCLA